MPGQPSWAPKMPGTDARTKAGRFCRRPRRIESQSSLLGALGFVGVWMGKGREAPIQMNPYSQEDRLLRIAMLLLCGYFTAVKSTYLAPLPHPLTAKIC